MTFVTFNLIVKKKKTSFDPFKKEKQRPFNQDLKLNWVQKGAEITNYYILYGLAFQYVKNQNTDW